MPEDIINDCGLDVIGDGTLGDGENRHEGKSSALSAMTGRISARCKGAGTKVIGSSSGIAKNLCALWTSGMSR